MQLVLFGCTGFVGQELVPQLLEDGHHLTLVSRKSAPNSNKLSQTNKLVYLQLDPSKVTTWENNTLLNALKEAEGIINLAGEPIAEKRWTENHCKKIANSRLDTTKELINTINQLRKPPRVLVNASAIGYYGTSQDKHLTEQSNSGEDFLAKLCEGWEAYASKKPAATRLVVIRIGIVLGPNGGALGKMLPIFKAGLGGPIGNGQQWMSWIHRIDLCQIIRTSLINKSWSGVVNGVAPQPVQMKDFASTLGKCLGRPSLLPVPGAILKLLLGDGARVVLEGQHVTSSRLTKLGFSFKYPELKQALSSICSPSVSL